MRCPKTDDCENTHQDRWLTERLTDDQQAEVKKNSGLIRWLVLLPGYRKRHRFSGGWTDLRQEAWMALITAVLLKAGGKPQTLGTLAERNLRWRMYEWWLRRGGIRRPRACKKKDGTYSDAYKTGAAIEVGWNGAAFDSVPAAEPEEQADPEVRRVTDRLLQRLSPSYREIVEMRFGLGGRPPMALREIADLHGCTSENVRQKLQSAMTKLKNVPGFDRAIDSARD